MPTHPPLARRHTPTPLPRLAAPLALALAAVAHGQPWPAPAADPQAAPAFDGEGVIRLPHVGCGKACRHRAHHADAAAAPAPSFALRGPGTTDPTDVLHNSLDIELTRATSWTVNGSNTMTIRSNVAGLTTFRFNLRSSFTVSPCTVTDSAGAYTVTPSTPAGNSYARTITLARPIAQGATFTVRVPYMGVPPTLAAGNWYAGGQLGGTQANQVITTLSEPYYAGTWWPCKDGDVFAAGDNADRATLDIAVTAPDVYQTVSNGLPVGVDTLSGSRKRYRWSTAYPIPTYLVFFSTSVYNQWQRTYAHAAGTMPVHFSLYPASDTAANRTACEAVLGMLPVLASAYGEYPFVNEKYGIYQFEFSGGMEHATYSGQGGNALGEDITVHELGHQWWGDDVTCRTWQDIWLNEGMATYTEALWQERKPQPSGQPLGLAGLKAGMAANRPSSAAFSGTVYVPAASLNSINRIFDGDLTYSKAAWVVHMLRRVMGDATFFNFLRTYRATFSGSAATSADFAAVASASAGQDLGWFFNQWVYAPGWPSYESAWAAATIDGRPYLRLSLRQTQASPAGLFRMPVDVRVTTAAGVQTVTVLSDAAKDDYLVPLAALPTAVAVDPDDWILTGAKTTAAYAPGPPKLVSASPAPGATAQAPAALTLGFSDPVTVAPSSVSVRKAGVAVPFTLAYDGAAMRATLTFAAPLGPGTYDVAVSDAVAATPGGAPLDGELASNTGAALPSGDGVAGGGAAFSFTVAAPPCPADYNGQNGVDLLDIFTFLADWFAGAPRADFNGQNGVDLLDIFAFLAAWFAGC